MQCPAEINYPFFAYGLFRPGQLAYFQLRELVNEVTDPVQIAGSLLLRDGLPIINPKGDGFVKGVLLTFSPVERRKHMIEFQQWSRKTITAGKKAKSTEQGLTCCSGVIQKRAASSVRRMNGMGGMTRYSP